MVGYSVHLADETIPMGEFNQRTKVEWPEEVESAVHCKSSEGCRQRQPLQGRNLDQHNDGCDLIKPTVLRPQRSYALPSERSNTTGATTVRSAPQHRGYGHSFMPIQRAPRHASCSHAVLGGGGGGAVVPPPAPLAATGGGGGEERAMTRHFRGTPQTTVVDDDVGRHDSHNGRMAHERPTSRHFCYSMPDSRRIDDGSSGHHYSSPHGMEQRNDPLWIGDPVQTRATPRRASIGCFVPTTGYPPDCELEGNDPVRQLLYPGTRAARRASIAHETDRHESVHHVDAKRAARRSSLGCSTPSPCRDFDSSNVIRPDALSTNTRARATRRASMEPLQTLSAGPPEMHPAGSSTTKQSKRPTRRMSLGSMLGALANSEQGELMLPDPERHNDNDPANQSRGSKSSDSAEPPTLRDLLFRQGMPLGTTDLSPPCSQHSCAHPDVNVDARRATNKQSMPRRNSLACTAAAERRPRVWV
jgi:hypothetical protein